MCGNARARRRLRARSRRAPRAFDLDGPDAKPGRVRRLPLPGRGAASADHRRAAVAARCRASSQPLVRRELQLGSRTCRCRTATAKVDARRPMVPWTTGADGMGGWAESMARGRMASTGQGQNSRGSSMAPSTSSSGASARMRRRRTTAPPQRRGPRRRRRGRCRDWRPERGALIQASSLSFV